METEPEVKKDFLSVDDVKKYLGIDYDDASSNFNIEKYIEVAKKFLEGAISNVPFDDERAKQLALFIIEDLYDRKSYSVKESSTLDKLKNDFILQLQCEARENGKL